MTPATRPRRITGTARQTGIRQGKSRPHHERREDREHRDPVAGSHSLRRIPGNTPHDHHRGEPGSQGNEERQPGAAAGEGARVRAGRGAHEQQSCQEKPEEAGPGEGRDSRRELGQLVGKATHQTPPDGGEQRHRVPDQWSHEAESMLGTDIAPTSRVGQQKIRGVGHRRRQQQEPEGHEYPSAGGRIPTIGV